MYSVGQPAISGEIQTKGYYRRETLESRAIRNAIPNQTEKPMQAVQDSVGDAKSVGVKGKT
jgi:hypothetical protein